MSTQPMTNTVNPDLLNIIQENLRTNDGSENSSLTRSDLATIMENITDDMSPKEAHHATHTLIDILSDSLIKGSRIEVRGFGTWEVRFLEARTAHNPRTGEKVKTIGKFRPHFKAGKSLKNRVNDFFLNKINTKAKAAPARIEIEEAVEA